MNFLVILTISIGILHLSQGIENKCSWTLSDLTTEDMTYEHVTLTSDMWGLRGSRKITDAGKICKIEVESESDEQNICKMNPGYYGIGDENHDHTKEPTTVWAENGCSATFKVYFLRGRCEHMHMGSVKNCSNGEETCPEQQVTKSMSGNILGMYMQNGDEGDVPCDDGRTDMEEGDKHDHWTYGWTEEKATVRHGCASDWLICHDAGFSRK